MIKSARRVQRRCIPVLAFDHGLLQASRHPSGESTQSLEMDGRNIQNDVDVPSDAEVTKVRPRYAL